MKSKFIPSICLTILLSNISHGQQFIFPGNMSLDSALVSHGQQFSPRRWAIDATGGIETITVGADQVSFDYSATPTPYGNWSVGGPAQGTNNIFTLPFVSGNLGGVVDINGDPVTLVEGALYRLAYTIKPSEFSFDPSFGTWAIGHGDSYDVQWSYNGNVVNSSVTLDVGEWKTVSFDFTYETGLDFVSIQQSLNGGAPNAVRMSGSGGPTPGANITAPTIQFAGSSPIPEPAVSLLCGISMMAALRRRRAFASVAP